MTDVFKKSVAEMDKIVGWGLESPDEYPLVGAIEDFLLGGGNELKTTAAVTCDAAFVEYCMEAGKLCNEGYFQLLAKTVIGYRECLNKYGWQKLFEDLPANGGENSKGGSQPLPKGDASPKVETFMEYSLEQQKRMRNEYSTVNPPEKVPEVANEFVLLYAKQYELGIAEAELIAIVVNLCEWLYEKRYTSTQVSLIKGTV